MTIKELSEFFGKTKEELKDSFLKTYLNPTDFKDKNKKPNMFLFDLLETILLNNVYNLNKIEKLELYAHEHITREIKPEKEDLINKKNKGFVYIMKSKNNNKLYKIGLSNDLNKRKKSFETGNPDIEVIASFLSYNPKYFEKQLHLLFKDHNYKNEWFTFTEKEIDNIIKTFNFNRHLK
jgi:hypothetical protein